MAGMDQNAAPVEGRHLKQELHAAFTEMFATALFVFFGVGSVNATRMTGEVVKPIDYALAFGLAITCLAYAVGTISGGHMNPAVTLSMMLTRNITITRGLFYIVAQFVGGIIGGATVHAVTNNSTAGYVSGITLEESISPQAGFGFEMVGTLLLLTVVFNVAVWTSEPLSTDLSGSTIAALAPVPIGFAVLVVHLVLGPYTGCGINPARVIGSIIFDKDVLAGGSHTLAHLYIYFVGPFTASIVAPLIYYGMHGTVKPSSQGEKKTLSSTASVSSVKVAPAP